MPPLLEGAKATQDDTRDEWRTPPYIMAAVHNLFGHVYDPCLPGRDVFSQDFAQYQGPPLWVNPPFSRYQAFAEHLVVAPVQQLWICHHRHSRKWFQTLMAHAAGLCLLEKAVHFCNPVTGKSENSAYGVSQSIIFIGHGEPGKSFSDFKKSFAPLGLCLEVGCNG